MSADEKHHKCELQQIVEYEVATNTSSYLDMFAVDREEVPHVRDLEEKQGKPVDRQYQSMVTGGHCKPIK